MTMEPTAPAPAHVLDAELREARRRLEELGRETVALRATVGSQQQLIDELRTALATLEGRTRRHERGQDHTAELRHDLAALRDQLEAEIELRREHGAADDSARHRERALAARLSEGVEILSDRVAELEQRLRGDHERQQHVVQGLAVQDRDHRTLDEALRAIDGELAALREQRHADATEQGQQAAALGRLGERVQELTAQQEASAHIQRRLDEEVSALRTLRERENDLTEAIEQTRAARHRLDERLAQQEREMSELRERLRDAAEDRVLTRQQAQAAEERTREIASELEEQRWAVVAHLRRVAEAADAQTRREIDDLQRRNRVQRELLQRFTEHGDGPRHEDDPTLDAGEQHTGASPL